MQLIPLRFQGGVAAPQIKRFRSSAAQTGWLVNSNKNEVRYADIYKEATRPFTNHPVCAAKERGLFVNGAATPSLKTEGNGTISQPTHPSTRPGNQPIPSPRVATYGTVLAPPVSESQL